MAAEINASVLKTESEMIERLKLEGYVRTYPCDWFDPED